MHVRFHKNKKKLPATSGIKTAFNFTSSCFFCLSFCHTSYIECIKCNFYCIMSMLLPFIYGLWCIVLWFDDPDRVPLGYLTVCIWRFWKLYWDVKMHLNQQNIALFFVLDVLQSASFQVCLKCLQLVMCCYNEDVFAFRKANQIQKAFKHITIHCCCYPRLTGNSLWSYISVYVFFDPAQVMLWIMFAQGLADGIRLFQNLYLTLLEYSWGRR